MRKNQPQGEYVEKDELKKEKLKVTYGRLSDYELKDLFKCVKYIRNNYNNMKEQCHCHFLLNMQEDRKIHIHLSGCPEDSDYQEYKKLPWYKKLFTRNPYNTYLSHF